MHSARRPIGLALCLAIALAGCDHGSSSAPAPAPAPSPWQKKAAMAAPAPEPEPAPVAQGMAPPAQAPAPEPAAAQGDEDGVSGTVVETMDASSYTYAKLDTGHGLAWVAGPQTVLAVGTKLGHMPGQVMHQFRSDTLNRTFDQIYFVGAYAVSGGAAPAPVTNPHGAPPAAAPAIAIAVEKMTPPPGGTAIGDVYAKKATLVGKVVTVRGKVVKLNEGILGKNWLHLRDGTGAAGTNDLLVTSTGTAKLGDVVTAKGTLGADKDFGAGYKYDLIVEDAAISQ
jgi:hypothetical protein